MGKKKSTYLLVSIFILMVCSSAFAKSNDAATAADSKNPEDATQHKILSFNLEGLTDRGDKKWEVKGQSAEATSETQVKMKNIVAKAYGKEAEATITADKGVYDKTKNNVTLEENVNATIENTEEVGQDYINFSDQLTGGALAKESRGKSQEPSKKTRTLITCDGEVVFNYENNQAYFNKNVKVVSDNGNIESEKITINLDPTTKKVKEIIAEGNVKITKGENITYSEKATYIESEKKIILTGRPKLVIYQEGSSSDNFLGK